jgi:hypothetical protein
MGGREGGSDEPACDAFAGGGKGYGARGPHLPAAAVSAVGKEPSAFCITRLSQGRVSRCACICDETLLAP